VLFAYLHSQHYGLVQTLIRLRGLNPASNYRIAPLDANKYTGEQVVSGALLMGRGVQLRLSGDYDSQALLLQRVTP
jgi:alpha-galactosidase